MWRVLKLRQIDTVYLWCTNTSNWRHFWCVHDMYSCQTSKHAVTFNYLYFPKKPPVSTRLWFIDGYTRQSIPLLHCHPIKFDSLATSLCCF